MTHQVSFEDPHALEAGRGTESGKPGNPVRARQPVSRSKRRRPVSAVHAVTFESGFKLLQGRVRNYKATRRLADGVDIRRLDDVDFVLIAINSTQDGEANRPAPGNACYETVEDDLVEARRDYLGALKELYHINYEVVSTPLFTFYLIHLPYHHLGLLAEILHYSWQIRTKNPKMIAFSHLTFFGGNLDKFEKCSSRSDFSPPLRYDLAYQFLIGASVFMDSPIVRPVEGCSCCPPVEQQRIRYDLFKVLADGLFDDWMIPHSPLNSIKPSGKIAKYCPGCVPCIESFRFTGDDIDGDNSRTTPDTNGIKGGEREFLCRYASVRNSLLKHTFPQADIEKSAGADLWHIIPIQQLCDYFGERIGFYFAWTELLIMSLVIPSILGAALFIAVAVYTAVDLYRDTTVETSLATAIEIVLIRACDNFGTPFFAVLMIIWGTVFHEAWIRRESWYQFLWNVEDLDVDELELLRGKRTTTSSNPNNDFDNDDNSDRKSLRFCFYIVSLFVTLIFICFVFGSIYLINVINIFSFDFCPSEDVDGGYLTGIGPAKSKRTIFEEIVCFAFSTAQVVANSVSVFILNALYTRVAYVLTDWEGHTRPSQYSNAVVLKLFFFRFFNFYSILFYTAFASNILSMAYLRRLIPGKTTSTYSDDDSNACGGEPCLMKLTRQLLGILVTQPIFNTLSGLVMPSVNVIYQTYLAKFSSKVGTSRDSEVGISELAKELVAQNKLLHLSALGRHEFETEEFTQRVITMGALLMFSVALPPAPALSIIFMRVDLTLDIRRIVTRYKRPIPHRSNGIGIWDNIVNFLTYMAIITNPLIVVLTSTWGSQFSTWWKFWIFILFEHAAVAIRALVAVAIPDIPRALEQEKLKRKVDKQKLIDDLILKR